MKWIFETPSRAALLTLCGFGFWVILVWLNTWLGLPIPIYFAGLCFFFGVGLAWTIWGVEQAAQHYEKAHLPSQNVLFGKALVTNWVSGRTYALNRVWNPLDPSAFYFGNEGQRLKQSLLALVLYTLLFFGILFLLTLLWWVNRDEYELPAGGGKMQAQAMKVEKVKKKKLIINPYSSILFNPPPIDQINPQLLEISQNLYRVGQGEGEGSGFAGGTGKGKIRFIRLTYSGYGADRDLEEGSDRNLLHELGARTQIKVADQPEVMPIQQLAGFPVGKSPPVVFFTGNKTIQLNANEKKILKEYLIDKHGMIFGNNDGSITFHNQFLVMMNEATGVQPVPIPLDDIIYKRPYPIPFFPYVAPHAGKDALGWKLDGRWVCYYHPADINDAWADNHAGVRPDVYEACYQLGINVILYAHAEYSTWLQARKQP